MTTSLEGEKKPVLENNSIISLPHIDRRPRDCVNLEGLSWLVAQHGEAPVIRPKDPAKNLKALTDKPGTVKLTWEKSKDKKVIGYRIYYGPRSNSYANHELVGNMSESVIKNLKPGKWYFSVAAHKKAYVECWKFSNEVVVEIKQ